MSTSHMTAAANMKGVARLTWTSAFLPVSSQYKINRVDNASDINVAARINFFSAPLVDLRGTTRARNTK